LSSSTSTSSSPFSSFVVALAVSCITHYSPDRRHSPSATPLQVHSLTKRATNISLLSTFDPFCIHHITTPSSSLKPLRGPWLQQLHLQIALFFGTSAKIEAFPFESQFALPLFLHCNLGP
jgi:hypothetical protein